ncbi:MAG: hypothetical protein FJ387_21750 [Verrucomicrobia bacterium]|nr:hypothetical protein [Verrucomicrobiota bacterium]
MNIKNRQQLLTLAALVAVALFVGDRLLFSPLVSLYKSRAAQLAELRQRVTTGERLLAREPAIRNRWAHMRTNTLPANPSEAEQKVLRSFDLWSQASRISVTSITPQWRREPEDYLTLLCRVDASGSLPALSRFLYDIEHDPMALKLESLELTARDKDGQQLTLALLVSGLMLSQPEPAARRE